MAVPNIFGSATSAIPLSQLDTNFATPVTIGNTAVQLGNTVTSFGNVTLTNVTISSGNVTITGANVSGTANVSTLIITGNQTSLGNVSITGNVSANIATFGAGSNTAPAITTTGDTNTGIFFPAADTIAFSEGGTESMRIDSSGNVGIGTTDTSNQRLKVKQSADTGAASFSFKVEANANDTGLYIGYRGVGAATAADTCAITATYGSTGGFKPITFLTSDAERMRIDSSGNVGIGTASPSTFPAKFAVSGFVASGGQNYSAGFSDAVNSTFRIGHQSGLTNLITDVALAFYTASAESMRIGSGGNVGIGAVNASDVRLLVRGVDAGATNYALAVENSSGFSLLYLRNDKYFNSGAIASYSTAGTALVIDGSNFVGKLTSSLRYKKDIVDYDKGLNAIVKLRPVYYKSAIEGPNGIDPKQHAGFIAEEIADEGFEEFLIRNNEGEPDAIQYAQMTALLCKAIQEQQAIIKSLTTRIAALEAK